MNLVDIMSEALKRQATRRGEASAIPDDEQGRFFAEDLYPTKRQPSRNIIAIIEYKKDRGEPLALRVSEEGWRTSVVGNSYRT